MSKVYKKTTPITQGDDVKAIQTALLTMKINIGNDGVDGKYGEDAKTAVEMFQKNYKPTHKTHKNYELGAADGIVGKNTILALDEAVKEQWRYQFKFTLEMLQQVYPSVKDSRINVATHNKKFP